MRNIAQQVEQRTTLSTTVRDVQHVLSATLASHDFWDIISLADRPFNQVTETLKALEEAGWVYFQEGRVFVSNQGLKRCQESAIWPRSLHRCSACDGRGISLEKFSEASQRFKQIARNRPEPVEHYDQAYVTPATTMARIAIMADKGDLHGRNLLVLGDDDLVGLAAALTGLPRKVTVVEVDERFVDFMARVGEAEGLNIEVVVHDLREPLPDNMLSAYDTFLTDPPDTVPGLELFIARGLSSLAAAGSAGYFGMTVIESSLPKWRDLQTILVGKYGVVITDIIDDFSTYVNWDYLLGTIRDDVEPTRTKPQRPWYKSSLYRLETLIDSRAGSQSIDCNDIARSEGLYIGPESLLWTREEKNVAGS